MPLSSCRVGRYIVKSINLPSELCARLNSLGVAEGKTIVVHVVTRGGVVISADSCPFGLSNNIAVGILAEYER